MKCKTWNSINLADLDKIKIMPIQVSGMLAAAHTIHIIFGIGCNFNSFSWALDERLPKVFVIYLAEAVRNMKWTPKWN